MKQRYLLDIDRVMLEGKRTAAEAAVAELFSGQERMTGWVKRPAEISGEELRAIRDFADAIAGKCEVLVVCGIGGSYHGAKAVYEAFGGKKPGRPELVFAGTNLSGSYQSRIIETIYQKSACLCVVSKSGSTLETGVSYSILKAAMYDKYGKMATDRIVVITDAEEGNLRQDTKLKNLASFDFPRDIGGRYSVITVASLFPIAVAGVDIEAFVKGAASVADESVWLRSNDDEDGASCLDYAISRVCLEESGKTMELFGFSDPYGKEVGEWIKQLFAESEGKDGRGLFPATFALSTDLHSIGQYLQEGKQFFSETIISVENVAADLQIPLECGERLGGKSLNEINQIAVDSVIKAHRKAGIPVTSIRLDRLDEFCLGQFMQSMMMSAAISAKLLHVDPFSQDGVEKYKKELRALLLW